MYGVFITETTNQCKDGKFCPRYLYTLKRLISYIDVSLDLFLLLVFALCICMIYRFINRHSTFKTNHYSLVLKATMAILIVVCQYCVVRTLQNWGTSHSLDVLSVQGIEIFVSRANLYLGYLLAQQSVSFFNSLVFLFIIWRMTRIDNARSLNAYYLIKDYVRGQR